METVYDYVLIGEGDVGKSVLLNRYILNKYEIVPSTISGSFLQKSIRINDKLVKLKIWDTARQILSVEIIRAYLENASAMFIVFDVCERRGFNRIESWVTTLRNNRYDDTLIIVLGNKCDLVEKRKVSYDEAIEKVNRLGLNQYYEVSAKENNNDISVALGTTPIESVFYNTTELVLQKATIKVNSKQVLDAITTIPTLIKKNFKYKIIGDQKVGKALYNHQVWINSNSFINKNKVFQLNILNINISVQVSENYIFKGDIISYFDGIIMIFDITNQSSLQYLLRSYKNNTQYTKFIQSGKASILIGNKCDLESNRQVSYQDGINAANQLNCCTYMETSSIRPIDDNQSGIYQSLFEITYQLLNKSPDSQMYSNYKKIDNNNNNKNNNNNNNNNNFNLIQSLFNILK